MAVDPRASRAPTHDAYGRELSPAPISFGEFHREKQAATNRAMSDLSDRMNDRLRYQKDYDEGRNPKKPGGRPNSGKVLRGVSEEQIDARPVPGGMSLRRATAAREHWVAQAEEEARYRNDLEALAGTGRVHAPRGTSWYSEHNAKYRALAEDTGIPVSDLIHAGTVLSPNSSPETELRSTRGVAGMANPDLEVTVSPEQAEVIRSVQTKGDARRTTATPVNVPAGTHRLGDLATPQAALLSSTVNMNPAGGRFEGMPPTVSEAASARNRRHVEKALGMLRGEITTVEANGVLTSPKMLGYSRSTQLGTPMEAERTHSQAMARVHPLEVAGQQQLPLEWNVVDDRSTAEDSWMHGMSYRPRDLGVVKPIGSDSGLGNAGAQGGGKDSVAASHAWNNEATNRAAERLGYTPQATQAISWTAQRIAAGKDPQYNAEQRAWDDAVREQESGARGLEGQGTLF